MKKVICRFPASLLLFIATITVALSCKKTEDVIVEEKQWNMTLIFKDDYINPKLKAIVFISDADGKTLADTLISGNPRLFYNIKGTISLPLQISIVTWEPDMHNFLVTIHTYKNVYQNEWTLTGKRLSSAGDATVNLLNVPAHSGPVLYANSGHSNLTFATTEVKHPVYQSPDDLYIRLITIAGPMYKWYAGLVPGGLFDIDISLMQSALQHTISFPFPAQDFHAEVSGYQDTAALNPLPIITDEQLGDGIAVNAVNVSYPPAIFSCFQTNLEAIDSWTSPNSWNYRKYGPIPDAFIKTDAMVNFFNYSGSSTYFKTSGTFTVTSAKWTFQDSDKLAFEWIVSGSDTITSIKLPAFPPSMKSMFPTLSPDSLHLCQFELTHYPSADSYFKFLEKVFSPSNGGSDSKLEAASVVQRVD